jgi:hypothetical protein
MLTAIVLALALQDAPVWLRELPPESAPRILYTDGEVVLFNVAVRDAESGGSSRLKLWKLTTAEEQWEKPEAVWGRFMGRLDERRAVFEGAKHWIVVDVSSGSVVRIERDMGGDVAVGDGLLAVARPAGVVAYGPDARALFAWNTTSGRVFRVVPRPDGVLFASETAIGKLDREGRLLWTTPVDPKPSFMNGLWLTPKGVVACGGGWFGLFDEKSGRNQASATVAKADPDVVACRADRKPPVLVQNDTGCWVLFFATEDRKKTRGTAVTRVFDVNQRRVVPKALPATWMEGGIAVQEHVVVLHASNDTVAAGCDLRYGHELWSEKRRPDLVGTVAGGARVAFLHADLAKKEIALRIANAKDHAPVEECVVGSEECRSELFAMEQALSRGVLKLSREGPGFLVRSLAEVTLHPDVGKPVRVGPCKDQTRVMFDGRFLVVADADQAPKAWRLRAYRVD